MGSDSIRADQSRVRRKRNGNGYTANKYRARKTIIDGIIFASKSEGQRYIDLKFLKESGKIRDYSLQPVFDLQPSFIYNGHKYRPIRYVADFCVTGMDGHTWYEDVKGSRGYLTEIFKIKMKMLLYKYPDIDFRIVTMK